MTLPVVSHAETAAASLARLLPARRGVAWQVGPAPAVIRAGFATARLTHGARNLDVVEQDGRIEVFADRKGKFPDAPDAVIAQTGPDPVAELAALILRVVLPRLAREAARATQDAHGPDRVLDTTGDLNEVGFALIDHGAHLDVVRRLDGVGVTWTASGGGEWGLWVLGGAGHLTLTYDGPVSGLYALLPVVLPQADGQDSDGVGSVFTRHLTDRFPQFHALNADEVVFGRREDVSGCVALPTKDEATVRADGSHRVVAQFDWLGTDLLLTAVSHLI